MMCEWLERAVGQGRFYFCLLHFHLVLPLLKWEILYHCVPCRSESVATYPLSQPFWLGFVPFLKPSSHVTIEAEVALGASLSQIILIHPAFSGTSTMRAFSWVTLFGTPQSAQEISSGCSLIGLILKLKFQYFGHRWEELTHLKRPWCWERLRAEEKGMTEDEMVGWHHWLNGFGFGWTWGVGDGQGGLVCCGSWGHKELDTMERLNWTESVQYLVALTYEF